MSFLNFRSQNKSSAIAKILTAQEASSKAALHEKHPHTKAIFEKHEIDLRKLRHKGTKVAATAAVLGAFLAFPHLLGNGSIQEPKPVAAIKTLSANTQVATPAPSNQAQIPNLNSHSTNPEVVTIAPTEATQSSDEDSRVDNDTNSHSQRHIHGRSYFAPPKEHGLHDLGLHKDNDIRQGRDQSPEPHPEDLGINHQEKNL